jgi:hypothetical protein
MQGASASPASDDNIHLWQATLFGPEETPWEGGIFNLTMSFGADYPERPPKVRFTTELFHPNVYGDGSLCLDILQDKWNPIYSVSSILVSIRVRGHIVLSSIAPTPVPHSPSPASCRWRSSSIICWLCRSHPSCFLCCASCVCALGSPCWRIPTHPALRIPSQPTFIKMIKRNITSVFASVSSIRKDCK